MSGDSFEALRMLLASAPLDEQARQRILAAAVEASGATESLFKLQDRCRQLKIKVAADGAVKSSGAAKLLGIEPGTLRTWREEGRSPPYRQAPGPSGHCHYPLDQLDAWMRARWTSHENK